MDELQSFLLLDDQHMAIIELVCAAVVMLCFFLRKSPWIMILWLPSIVLTAGYTCLLGSLFVRGFIGRGESGGWHIMAGMMQTFVTFPIVLTAILLLVLHPIKSAWHPRYLIPSIATAAVAPIGLMFLFTISKPTLNFIVTDEAGRPLGGVAVRDAYNSPVKFTTDRNGAFRDRLPYRDIFACCFTADGYQEHHLTVSRGGAHGETYYIDHAWIDHGPIHITTTDTQRVQFPSQQPDPIPVTMKKMPRRTPEPVQTAR